MTTAPLPLVVELASVDAEPVPVAPRPGCGILGPRIMDPERNQPRTRRVAPALRTRTRFDNRPLPAQGPGKESTEGRSKLHSELSDARGSVQRSLSGISGVCARLSVVVDSRKTLFRWADGA